MKNKFLYAVSAFMLTACSIKAIEPNYTVTAQFNEEDDDLVAYIIDYDNSQKIDSATITDGIAIFKGHISEPRMARLIVDGGRRGSLILEPGVLDIKRGKVSGGSLNAKLDSIDNCIKKIAEEFRAVPDSLKESQYKAFDNRVKEISDKAISENISNPIGYYLFLQNAYDISLEELDGAIAKTPALGEYVRIQKLRTSKIRKAETSEGKMFKDFTITYNDSASEKVWKLSDFVGKGNYTLVDFWASWCGPCIRETAVIKDIYNEFNPKGLEVVGVAVWDEPEKTLEAIEKHKLPWKHVINAQTIPTDIYGIPAIPCIILFGPDGTIIARDKTGDDLKEAVRTVFEKK